MVARELDHNDGHQRADLGPEGWDPTTCTVEDCDACEKVNAATSNPGLPPSELAQIKELDRWTLLNYAGKCSQSLCA